MGILLTERKMDNIESLNIKFVWCNKSEILQTISNSQTPKPPGLMSAVFTTKTVSAREKTEPSL